MRYGRAWIAAALAMILALVVAPPIGAAPPEESTEEQQAAASVMDQLAQRQGQPTDFEAIEDLDDLGPKPWLSFTDRRSPEALEAWKEVAAQLPAKTQLGRRRKPGKGLPIRFSEHEPVDAVGQNDTPATGELVKKFGTGPSETQVAILNGSLSGGVIRQPIEGDCESTEDDGSIGTANPTPAVELQIALCIGEIGDGPFGDSSGDIDFYSWGEVEEGSTLILDTWHIADSLDPVRSVIGIYDSHGVLLESIIDGGLPGDDPVLFFTAPADGEYFAAIAGCCGLSNDPFDPASGPGVGDTGTYELFVGAFPPPCASIEDDGTIPTATVTNLVGQGYDSCIGEIGDGPHGAADSDFFKLSDLAIDDLVFIDAYSYYEPAASMVVGLYAADGTLIASAADDGSAEIPEVVLNASVPADGDYYVAVSGCCELPADPFDPASAPPSDQAGLYDLFVGVFPPPCESSEDDGAIGLANKTHPFAEGEIRVAECFGQVGDGPQAEVNGDVDFFQTPALAEGRTLLVDMIDYGDSAQAGQLTIGIYDEAGQLIASGSDDPSQGGPGSDYFSITVPAEGVYYVAVGGALPGDPFDPTTGTNTDIVSPYNAMYIVDADPAALEFAPGSAPRWWPPARTVDRSQSPRALALAALDQAKAELAAEPPRSSEPVLDVDVYLVELDKGDAISGGFDSSRSVTITDPEGVVRSGSGYNTSFIYPAESPLRHARRNGFDHVATVKGIHAIAVTDGVGAYEGELRVVKSGLASRASTEEQILYIDFDGATIPGEVWETGFDAELSPLSDFLERWDLTAHDEDQVIDATLDAIIETVDHDLRVRDGRNGDRDRKGKGTEFDVAVLNSRDHPDVWGQPNVTRIVIGGTIDELGIPTLGIAQTIDPGNTDTTETAVVLLDVMSEPEGYDASINSYPVDPGADKADFVGFVLGHIAAHEIGHVIGNWHQETFNETQALMDAGGDFPAIAGVGADGIWGTDDDTDPDFVEDIFDLYEGFVGVEDTAGRSVFGLATGTRKVKKSAVTVNIVN